jgi:hypothetical protein
MTCFRAASFVYARRRLGDVRTWGRNPLLIKIVTLSFCKNWIATADPASLNERD